MTTINAYKSELNKNNNKQKLCIKIFKLFIAFTKLNPFN